MVEAVVPELVAELGQQGSDVPLSDQILTRGMVQEDNVGVISIRFDRLIVNRYGHIGIQTGKKPP
jgi:hypothetical protein